MNAFDGVEKQNEKKKDHKFWLTFTPKSQAISK